MANDNWYAERPPIVMAAGFHETDQSAIDKVMAIVPHAQDWSIESRDGIKILHVVRIGKPDIELQMGRILVMRDGEPSVLTVSEFMRKYEPYQHKN